MIAVIDYDTGNLCSVANALKRLGVEYRITADPSEIRAADRVLLPGVGEASSAMQKLRERGLVEVIRSLTQPVWGSASAYNCYAKAAKRGMPNALESLTTGFANSTPFCGSRYSVAYGSKLENIHLLCHLCNGAYRQIIHFSRRDCRTDFARSNINEYWSLCFTIENPTYGLEQHRESAFWIVRWN